MKEDQTKVHPMEKYRPEWCHHPPFDSIDYCWGLLVLKEADKIADIAFCAGCEFCHEQHMEGHP